MNEIQGIKLNVTDREDIFEVKDLNEIISEIEESRNFLKECKAFFKRDMTPIYKSWLDEIKNWLNERELYIFHSSQRRFLIIISESYLNQELKFKSFVSFFFNLKERLLENENEFIEYCKSFFIAFNNLEQKDINFNDKFKKFTIFLIKLTKEKIHEQSSYKLIKNYLSLLRLASKLVKIEILNESEFLKYISVLDHFSNEYDIKEKFDILLDYYSQTTRNLNEVQKIFFHFLDTHKRKDIFSISYPDPVKFCEDFEERFKKRPKNFLINMYLEYYRQHTTNFIPPLFLKKKSLTIEYILKIIYKNIQSENFISRDMDRYFEILLKSKPRKRIFNQYCKTITGFKSHFFRFNFYKIYESKNMSFSRKFALIREIISTKPDFYQIKHHPQSHTYLVSGRNYKKKRNLKAYFKLVSQLENYSDFKMFLFKISIKDRDQRKYFIKISNNSIKYLFKRMKQILEQNEFLTLIKLYNIFETDFYNIYKLGHKTMNEYVTIEFSSNSFHLKNFLYEHFIEIAQKLNDSKTDTKLFLDYQNFKKSTISDKTFNDILDEFSYDDLNRNHSIEYHHFLMLIKSNDKDKFFRFVDDLIANEQNRRFKNYEILIVLHFLKGEIQNCLDLFQEEIEFNRKQKFDEETSIKDNKRQNNLNMFKEILRIEQNFENYGSFKDLLSDLEKLLKQIKQNLVNSFGYFLNIDIYKHYWNVSSFLILIQESEEEKNTQRKRQYSILDTLYLNTYFCKEWKDLKELWVSKIIPNLYKDDVSKYAKDQFEVFKINPLFSGVNKFLATSLNPGSELYLLFNYDPENLVHDFKEMYYNINEIFIKKYKSNLFAPLNFEDVRLFNNLHIPFSNSRKDLKSFILTLNTAISGSIIPKVLKLELKVVKWDGNKINLLIKFIEEKYDMEKLSIKELLFGIIELNTFRSKAGIAHRIHQDHKKILSKFSLLNLSNIEISKKILSDVNMSLENLIELFK